MLLVASSDAPEKRGKREGKNLLHSASSHKLQSIRLRGERVGHRLHGCLYPARRALPAQCAGGRPSPLRLHTPPRSSLHKAADTTKPLHLYEKRPARPAGCTATIAILVSAKRLPHPRVPHPLQVANPKRASSPVLTGHLPAPAAASQGSGRPSPTHAPFQAQASVSLLLITRESSCL